MIRPIIKIEFLLKRPSSTVTPEDLPVVEDLLDTLEAHASECVGLAGNMIGVLKRAIVFMDFGDAEDYDESLAGAPNRVMLNPEIVAKDGEYFVSEGCLSLKGMRSTRRFDTVTVKYQDTDFAWHEEEFKGFTAQIIQHEIDHCNGILI